MLLVLGACSRLGAVVRRLSSIEIWMGVGDTSLEDFDSEVVYLGKAGQQTHPALILKRGLVDEAIL